jgi:hypothetical protein
MRRPQDLTKYDNTKGREEQQGIPPPTAHSGSLPIMEKSNRRHHRFRNKATQSAGDTYQ